MSRLTVVAGVLLLLAACDSAKPSSSSPPSSATAVATKKTSENVAKAATEPKEGEPPVDDQDAFPKMSEFIVAPVDGEAVWPSPSDEKEIARRGFLTFKGGYLYELKGPDGQTAATGVVVDGRILLDRGIVELLGCGEGGKEYESILRLDADVHSLDLALNLCGLKRGPVPARLADPNLEQGSRLLVLLQWEDEAGKTITHRAEDCVVNIQRKAPMPRVGWTYVGAMLPLPDPASTSGKTFRVLAGAGTRSLLTTYRDSTTLLDNPLPDAVDDSLYVANYMVLPSWGTKVRVILRSPDEAARKEIARLEEELAK